MRPGERVFVLWTGLKGTVPILPGAFIVQAKVTGAPRIYESIFVVVAFSVIGQGAAVPASPGGWACRCAPSSPDRGAWTSVPGEV